MPQMLIITQIKSSIGRKEAHQRCLSGLGITRMHKAVKVLATRENLGMIARISYMLRIEEQ